MQWEYGGSFIHLFFLVWGQKKGGRWRCPRAFRPHNVANDEGEGNWVTAEEKGKVSSIIFTFFFYVVLFLIYFSAFSVLSLSFFSE
jgi:hypothetical protein